MKLDNIIFDVKPHEVDEAVKLLEAWGYDTRIPLHIKAKCIEADCFGIYVYTSENMGRIRVLREALNTDVLEITLEELRAVTIERAFYDNFAICKPSVII